MNNNNTKQIIRCTICKSKLKLISYSCSCGGFFCNNHRTKIDHNCDIENIKKKNKNMLEKNNPNITKDKLKYRI
jgi:predicted nucleic acid binding AN1-type Zn finger protein